MWFFIILILSNISSAFSYYSIEDYGAVENNKTNEAAKKNVQAILDAFDKANQDSNQTNRVVLLPPNKTFYFFNVSVSNLINVTLRIEGTFATSNNISEWENILGPLNPHINDEDHPSSLIIVNSTNFELTGNGILDGQGHDWWASVYSTQIDHRPFLCRMKHCKDVEIHHIHFKNTPFWTMDYVDMLNMHIHDIDIYVDWPAQRAFAKKFGYWNAETDDVYPLNTDGMDLRGKNILVENVKIECGDDAVAIKPTNAAGHEQNCSVTGVCMDATNVGAYTNCSQDMVIRNIITIRTDGLAIGSIPPDPAINCIRNITFENIWNTFEPYHMLYIKTNPGNVGQGIVDSITARNIYANASRQPFITISPQAQKQPGTNGTGCDPHWPFNGTCNTQPLVSISNILVENAIGENSNRIPGILWCDKTNPCKNITFINVRNSGNFSFMQNYLCQNAEGTQIGTNNLPTSCLAMVGEEQNTTTSSAPNTGNQTTTASSAPNMGNQTTTASSAPNMGNQTTTPSSAPHMGKQIYEIVLYLSLLLILWA